jgi:DNA-binding transcriptional MocR family regulator
MSLTLPPAPAPDAAAAAHLYEQVARQIQQLVQQGTLRPGDRVPSVRKLVRQKGVSVATVLQAYRLLEARGVIEARPQSGFYVRPPRWTPAPEPEMFRPAGTSKNLSMAGLVLEVVGTLNRPGLVNFGAAVPNQ